METATVWMSPPWGVGEPKEVEARPEIISRLMVAGWSQCAPPTKEEVKTDGHDH